MGMIDWEETEHRFHVTTKTATRKSRVVVICPVCRSKRELILDSYKKTIALRGNAPCMSCRNKENRQKYADNYRKSDTNRAKSLAQTMKKKWEDPSYRQRQTKAINKKRNRHGSLFQQHTKAKLISDIAENIIQKPVKSIKDSADNLG